MAATTKFTNNAISKLAGALTNVATSFSCTATEGAKFPTLTGSNWFMLTLTKIVAGVAQYEIVKVTARSTDTFTVVRAQEGTTALTFSAGDVIEHRITAGTIDEFVKKGDDNTISGLTTFTGKPTLSGVAIDEAKGANVASAGTVDLTSTTGNLVHITGTTTITAITIPSGAERTLVFDGALTLTHNATTLILPTGANITTAAGDAAIVRGDGSGNARVISYNKANGNPVATIPSSALVLLATLTPTAAANVDALSTFSSTYDGYLIIGEGIKPASASNTLSVRLANAGSADSGSNYYQVTANNPTTTADTSFQLCNDFTEQTGKGANFSMYVLNANDATNNKSIVSSGSNQNSTTSYYADFRAATYKAANAVSGLRFFWNSGSNFSATGKIRIYGISNT